MKLKELRQKKADLAKKARAKLMAAEEAHESGDLKLEEECLKEHDELMTKLENNQAALDRHEAMNNAERELGNNHEVDEGDEYEPTVTGGGHRLPPYANIGEMCLSIMQMETGGVRDPRLNFQAATGASGGVAADGGYLVQQDISREIMRRTYDIGLLTSRVSRVPISQGSNGMVINALDESSRQDGSRLGGVLGYWLAEAEALTKSKPKFRPMNLRLKKVGALFYATDELLADAGALSAIIMQSVPQELNFQVENAIVNGDGSAKPKGWTNTAGDSPMITIAKETGQAAATIVTRNILKMYARMYAPSLTNAIWLVNQDTLPQLMELVIAVGTGGRPIFLPADSLAGRPHNMLLGHPIMQTEYCETLGTAGGHSVC